LKEKIDESTQIDFIDMRRSKKSRKKKKRENEEELFVSISWSKKREI